MAFIFSGMLSCVSGVNNPVNNVHVRKIKSFALRNMHLKASNSFDLVKSLMTQTSDPGPYLVRAL